MSNSWVVDPDHPEGHLVPMTADEETQLAADHAADAVAATRLAAGEANARVMRQQLAAHLTDALALADALDANTATPAQQRQAVSLCLRGTVRLSRLVLELFDQAA